MGQGFRRGFTASEKTELWDRWQRGESLKTIGRAFGKPSSSIYFQLPPPAPWRLDAAFVESLCQAGVGLDAAGTQARIPPVLGTDLGATPTQLS